MKNEKAVFQALKHVTLDNDNQDVKGALTVTSISCVICRIECHDHCHQESVDAKSRQEGRSSGARELVSVMNGKVPLKALVEALRLVKQDKLADDIWSSAGR